VAEEQLEAEVGSREEAAVQPDPEVEPETAPQPDEPDLAREVASHLLDVDVRLWAELGRARLPLANAVALGTGAIVDLDKEPQEPLDVVVNGRVFAQGTLLLVDGEWAVRIERIVESPTGLEQASTVGSGA
jgi:flagellar motor switch protein FliN